MNYTAASTPGSRLAAQAEPLDQLLVARAICSMQVRQQATATADHLQQATAAVMIVDMNAQVSDHLIDPVGQQCDLHFRRAGVVAVRLVIADDLCTLFFFKSHDTFDTPY